ncbi:MAG: 1,4-alpha-glucan branching protein GlgB, partial [Chlamydiia bacterium]|nr:1,4-alpha-glucan branching protein GlgB [Chlamydiia bacterium]
MSSLQNLSFDVSLHDPHRLLGLHATAQGAVIRLWRPGAEKIYIEVKGELREAERVDSRGLFELLLPEKMAPIDYRVYHHNGLLAHDPYAFWPTLGEMDLFLFNKGCHYELFSVLGAHAKVHQGVTGVQFAIWAPNAKGVSVVADFNHWDGRINPMRSMGGSGIWELFVPGLQEGEKYKFEILAREGYVRLKSDPFAFYSELRPQTASLVWDVDRYLWQDATWIASRTTSNSQPMLIYEVHLGSWKNYGKEFPNYREIAIDLAQYCKKMGFTHVELLPILEHPLDESWGYQVTGFFSVTSRYGTPTDFQFFVDHMHQEGIGVILDWVPAHFPTDDDSLNRFDGTALYEHEDPRKGIHPHWGTAIFNYGRHEVSNFLIASALFWLEKMHVDGLRVDAVASMVYLDYGRKAGEWIPNPDGSNFNVEGIEFLKHLNAIVRERHPGTWMIAEESSSFTGVTHPVDHKGLGFHMKWNMGWMNDTLCYFSRDSFFRKFHQNELTFSLLYAYSEKFLLVLSHDEVVHGKKSLLSKMPGTDWQKFANLRLLYSYMICHPGKKLLFMGGEIGQLSEWDCKGQIDWPLEAVSTHSGVQKMVRDLNHFYRSQPALWEWDFDWQGYEWVDFSDWEKSVVSYLRKSPHAQLLCVHNFTPEFWSQYRLPLKGIKKIREVFNSDHEQYGGSHKLNSLIGPDLAIDMAPLATMIF